MSESPIKIKMSLKKLFFCLFILALLFVWKGCTGEPAKDPDVTIHAAPPLKISSPANDDQFTIGEIVEVKLEIKDPLKVKNLELFVDDTLYQTGLKSESQTIKIDTKNGRVGYVKLFVSYTDDKGENHGDTRIIVFFSDIIPAQKKAVKVKLFPHDKASYTQGLEFYKGKLYEGTGHAGKSVLAEVNLESGSHTRFHKLDEDIFGEGITILNDTIYQLSWQNKICFVYDMNFSLIKQFTYEGEGWGLCNDGKSLIMTDGTSEIVWRNPRTFEIEKRLDVFSNEDSIESLNELELVDGNLFINVYGENYIVEVDTSKGKVLSKIDCSDIVKEGRIPGADVLNGIARDQKTGKIYITGKWWPKMFEVIFE